MKKVTGRKTEISLLNKALKSKKAELIVVYGRRRIGKTFLINQTYKSYIKFELTGIYNASLKDQLKNFQLVLSKKNKKQKTIESWLDAFFLLSQYLDTLKSKSKKVIFFDEFPWLDTRRSKFLPAFENFWNSYISKRNDIVVVICGSAASYMINKIIMSKGGLHNRLTQKIHLKPFNLAETEKLLSYNKVRLSRYDILLTYMALGGIPFYLEKIIPGESVAQTIDRLCFSQNGFLRTEFKIVFASLFEKPENHELIVRVLSKSRKGLTRNEILKKSKVQTGGTMSKALLELEESGFIENYTPYKGKKNALYRLTDEYSLFYLKYIEGSKPIKKGYWIKMQKQQSFKSWTGFSFETICIKHFEQIVEALRISGIHSTHGSWFQKNIEKGAQIDLLIDRDDNVINLCEMKFYNSEFTIDKKYAKEIAHKLTSFTKSTKTKKSVFVTFISTYGLKQNIHSTQYIQNELKMDILFEDL